MQSWDGADLGQYILGTVRSWGSGLGTVVWDITVLGQWSWGSGLRTVLGRCGLGTVQSWDSGLGTVVLAQ